MQVGRSDASLARWFQLGQALDRATNEKNKAAREFSPAASFSLPWHSAALGLRIGP
ncbi:MAG TPA: hypothetical protein VK395_13805 [Gemmataceae bacterium]|nr:hypothetical protein [Gemmataceae bacterium]